LSDNPRPEPGSPPPDGTQNLGPAYVPGGAPIPPPQPPPPVNYAPPGYAPDYGPGYQYPPPPYGAGDYPPAYPPAPARKSNAPLIAVVIAVALLLCGGVSTAGILIAHNVRTKAHDLAKPLTDPTVPDVPDLPGGGFPTELPTDTGKQIQVTYEVTGDGPAQIIYLSKLGASPTRVTDAKLPWRFTAPMETPTLISVVAVRADSDDGKLTCRALVDGKEVKTATSGDGSFATASCIYFALD
jgi:hypothetical protein